MATFTKGTAYKFIGNNLPENQCVTYSMFEVYNVPITAYNITVNVYLRESVNLVLEDMSPMTDMSPSEMGDNMQLIPYSVALNIPYEDLNYLYYYTLPRNKLGIRKMYSSKNYNGYWSTSSEMDEEIERFSDNGVVSLNGLKNRYWYPNGERYYITEIANLGTNNYLIWNITATNINTPTLPISEEFYLLVQGVNGDLEEAAAVVYRNSAGGEYLDSNLPFQVNFDNLETIPYISLRNNANVSSISVQKEVITDSSNNGVKTLSINYYISDICFSGDYISEK